MKIEKIMKNTTRMKLISTLYYIIIAIFGADFLLFALELIPVLCFVLGLCAVPPLWLTMGLLVDVESESRERINKLLSR